jgi:opacity protein-like surface antigen
VGFNLTRNLFLETGYRYFYMDYATGGFLYKAAEAGLFTGIGVKF